jgi:prepilin-type N-terminal cleavage/methylation domain-containing protein
MVLTLGRRVQVRACSRSGFTLVEVMAAMTLLTIGALGAQSVAVAVARSVGDAEWKNRAVAAGITAMEQARLDVALRFARGSAEVPPGGGCRVERDLEVCVEFVPPQQAGASSGDGTGIRVTVSRPGAGKTPFSIRSDVFPPVR